MYVPISTRKFELETKYKVKFAVFVKFRLFASLNSYECAKIRRIAQ